MKINPWIMMCLAIIVAGCGKPPEKTAATLVESQPAAVSEPAPPPQGPAKSYKLADDTQLNFTGYKVTGKKEGSFFQFEGGVTIHDDNLETARMELTIFMEAMITDDDTLTEVLLSDKFFNVKVHPDGRFVSTGVRKTDDGFIITGDLTLNGVTKTLEFPATMTLTNNEWRMNTDFQADRQWWNLTYKGLGEHVMLDRVDIQVIARAIAE